MNIPVTDLSEVLETREKILLASEKRFEFYGYNKTTMAEIADDLDMSAANLYRFYKNKKSIAEACVKRCIDDRLTALRSVLKKSGASASEKLSGFIQTSLEVSYEQLENKPKINELVISVSRESTELVMYKLENERQLLGELVKQGNQAGEFSVQDVEATASALHTSILLFDVPLFMGLYSLQEFRTMANQTTELLLRGLLARKGKEA